MGVFWVAVYTEAAPVEEDSSEGSEGSAKKRDSERRRFERAFVRVWHRELLAVLGAIIGRQYEGRPGDGVVEAADRASDIMAYFRALRTRMNAPRWLTAMRLNSGWDLAWGGHS